MELYKLFISGSYSADPEKAKAQFLSAEERLCIAGFTVLNPIRLNISVGAAWNTAMRKTIQMMLDAEGVALLNIDDLLTSAGTLVEVQIAKRLDMPVLSVNNWLNIGHKEEQNGGH